MNNGLLVHRFCHSVTQQQSQRSSSLCLPMWAFSSGAGTKMVPSGHCTCSQDLVAILSPCQHSSVTKCACAQWPGETLLLRQLRI